MLVPLTSAMYAEGTVSDPSQVLVDIGTGYFLQVCQPQSLRKMHNSLACIRNSLLLDTKHSALNDMLIPNCIILHWQVTLSIFQQKWLLHSCSRHVHLPLTCCSLQTSSENGVGYCKRKINFLREQIQTVSKVSMLLLHGIL